MHAIDEEQPTDLRATSAGMPTALFDMGTGG